MTEQQDILSKLSEALAARVSAARTSVVAIRRAGHRNLSGILWRPDVAITSEQSLASEQDFEIATWDGTAVAARLAGRDPGTNIAALKLEKAVAGSPLAPANAQTGALAITLGANEAGLPSARLGIVNSVGPEWNSTAGGRIEQRIVIDLALARREEGGPVIDVSGGWLGMSTLGPRRQVLAIPHATIERIAPTLLKDGRIARGWIGFALQPVAVPDGLREAAGVRSGLMVMSVADDGPAAKAGIVPGDIVIAVDGEPARRFGRIAARLGGDSLGRDVSIGLIRSGAIVTARAKIEERPPHE